MNSIAKIGIEECCIKAYISAFLDKKFSFIVRVFGDKLTSENTPARLAGSSYNA